MNSSYVQLMFFSVLTVIAVYFLMNVSHNENFDESGTEFPSLGKPRYGLTGRQLRTRPIYDCRYDCYTNCYNSHK